MKRSYLYWALLILALLGVADSIYLTIEHFKDTIPPCTIGAFFVDCGQVLQSKYSEILGIPLALLGALHYGLLTALIAKVIVAGKRLAKFAVLILSTLGVLFSAWLVYLQLGVIGAICPYCMLSALISLLLFIVAQVLFPEERKRLFAIKTHFIYKNILKPIFFAIDAETIHDVMINLGERLGRVNAAKSVKNSLLKHDFPQLEQRIEKIKFTNPVGLAAGFDYEAQLTQILPSLGFGFQSVGTITNIDYEGNPKPRLGRLPKSRSLMVNKGFKSTGAKAVAKRLEKLTYKFPLGVSIGRTNSPKLKTQKQSTADIITAFKVFENPPAGGKVKHSYYELNISCPNLIHGEQISFYPPKNLEELLTEVDKLKLKKPVFVKMPIEKSNRATLTMLEVIAKHSPVGVIFGNLQKNKKHPSLNQDEVKKFKMGFFSGKPTWDRSNELIKLTYKHYKDRFVIVGCGGIFSGADAYEKIRLGASLVQFITGMIYEGPQLAASINFELVDLLEKEGFKHISEAVGTKA